MRPVVRTTLSVQRIRSPFISPRWSFQGSTKPVLPRTEIPPSTPILLFRVSLPTLSPSGIEIVTSAPRRPSSSTASCTAALICAMGFGLIAGWPFGTWSPSLFTTPMPFPPRIRIPSASLASPTKSRPRVMSDSWSFRIFLTTARPEPDSLTSRYALSPAGVGTETWSTVFLRERTAAFAAAVAVVPVVYPRFRTDPSLRTTIIPDATFSSTSSLGIPVRAIHSSGMSKLLTGSIMEDIQGFFV